MFSEKVSEGVSVLGIGVDPLTVPELHGRVADAVQAEDRVTFLHVNVHAFNLACRYPWLHDYLNSADLVVCDGAGVQLAARLLGGRLPARITYADWIWQLAAFAELEGFTLFLLGARPGVAQEAALRLRERYDRLNIVGCHHGYFDHRPDSADNLRVIEAINAASPDILITAFGMPLQERWLADNRVRLDVRVALAGGAVLDYVSGRLARGPRWMTDNGLEWLARLLIEPGRLWRRYLVGNPQFLGRVVLQRLRMRFRLSQ
ncbi:MAG: WecB/TagA/CpsF family glycosyltransferase [Caldilineaceae bacterium]|nr:WecB/TagA/CpsF family glycosyltransferase [Caldilineaceae bacterium]